MQRILAVLAVMVCLAGGAKAAPVNPTTTSDWQRVMQLKPGTSVHLRTTSKKSTTCKVSSVDENGLACASGNQNVTYSRNEIQRIKLNHRGRSAMAGFLVGAGVGAGIGAAVAHADDKGGWFSGLVTGVGALFGGVIGAVTGTAIAAPLDVTSGAPIYESH